MSTEPPSPRRRFRLAGSLTARRARFIVALLVASNLYFAYDRWGESLRDQVVVLWAQRKCLTFEMPPDRVVLEASPNHTPLVLAAGREPFDRFVNAWQKVGDWPDNWEVGSPDSTAVFVHDRQSRAGNARLVVVEASLNGPGAYIRSIVIVPGTVSHPPREQPSNPAVDDPDNDAVVTLAPSRVEDEDKPGVLLRVFAGRVDPSDASRFTMNFENLYGRGTIEGVLNDDDSVTLKVISGTPAAWSSSSSPPMPQ